MVVRGVMPLRLNRLLGGVVAAGLLLAVPPLHASAVAQVEAADRGEAGAEEREEQARVSDDGEQRKVVFIAGTQSHGYGAHEHYAGSVLLSDLLSGNHDQIETVVFRDGWPSDPNALDDADAIVIFANGGPSHPALPHLEQLGELMNRGVGLVLLHYAVEVPADDAGPEFMAWVGGYFETHWSVNPFWTMRANELPNHPISRGVTPYEINDEWYYHMRFRGDGVRPILTALPPPSSLDRPDGPHSGNPDVREAILERREPQHVAWAMHRDNGGRGFGFTGAHWHWNWGHPMQRRVVLNAIAWAARAEVPEDGIDVGYITMEDLEANQDYDPPEDFDREHWLHLLEEWQRDYADR
jgi:hypothetical protein